jgi:transcription initiation factor TFIIIB Brf1 subunit/transcription initiation factor TFIIB
MLTLVAKKESQKNIRAREDFQFNKKRKFQRDKLKSDSIEFFRFCHELEQQQMLEKKFNRILNKANKKKMIDKEFESAKSNMKCIFKSKKKMNEDVSNKILSYLSAFESKLIKYY